MQINPEDITLERLITFLLFCRVYLTPSSTSNHRHCYISPQIIAMPSLSSRKAYPLADHLQQKSREEHIRMAVDAIHRSGFRKDGHFQMSYRKAEKLYSIPRTTILN
jgi:hypothetical protein